MKKIVMVSVAGLLLIFLVYQGSIAFFHADATVGTKISSGSLGIELVQTSGEENATKTKDGYQYTSVMPGHLIDSALYVKNVKDYSVYVRVTVEKYWVDQEGNKLPEADASLIKMVSKDPQNWIMIDDAANSNSELVYFYYKLPIKSNTNTSNFVDHIQIDPALQDTAFTNYQVHVGYEADAVQSVKGQEAILSEWGVDITTDSNGIITSIEG